MALTLSASLRKKFIDSPTSKVAQMLLGTEFTTTAEGNYLTLRENGLLAYLPAGRESDNPWARNGRQEGRPARVARKFITEEGRQRLVDGDFEQFANILKAEALATQVDIRLVRGEEIRFWYHMDNMMDSPSRDYYGGYCPGKVFDSCMSKPSEQDRCQLYVDNPLTISLLGIFEQDKIRARALVWETNLGTAMDYVYHDGGSDEQILKDYGAVREWMTLDYYGVYDCEGNKTECSPTVALEAWDYGDRYPHIDRFKWITKDDPRLLHTGKDAELRKISGYIDSYGSGGIDWAGKRGYW